MQMKTAFNQRPWLRLVIAMLLLSPLAVSVQAEQAHWKQLYEHWYSLEIAGATAGWMREAALDDGRRYRLDTEVHFSISRGPVQIEASSSTTSLETHDGQMIELSYRQDMGQMKVNSTWTFKDDHVQLVSRQGGQTLERKLDLPEGQWLTAMAVQRYWLERREAGAEEITYRTVNPEYGMTPMTSQHVLKGEEEYDHNGRTIPVTVWKATSSVMPGIESIVKVSADGHQVYQEMPMGGMLVVTRVTTKEKALAAANAPPPELMISTFVKPDRPIERPMQARSMKLRLKTREGQLPRIPTAGAQKVEVEDGGEAAVLTIDVEHPLPADNAEAEDAIFREPSTMANSDDPLIRKLAERALRDAGQSAAERATAMRSFVHKHITAKSLDTAFASASETARMKTGDCSEHGVLLCALLRAGGIPSRVASGLLYVDEFAGENGVYGWHMWTQALIDGAWVDLDATLDVPYHAGHVLTGTSSLADGIGDADLAAMMVLIGNLDIEIIDVGYGDAR